MIFTERPTKAVIDLASLAANFRALTLRLPRGQESLPVVKANGYGLGAVPVAKTLIAEGAKRLGVAAFEEALALREAGIAHELCVLNGILAPLEKYREFRLIPVLHHIGELRDAARYAELSGDFPVHLKFDTGMGRLGLLPEEIHDALACVKAASKLKLTAVLTHLARADEGVECTITAYQRFQGIRQEFRTAGFDAVKFSICNSASILDAHFEDYDWVRPGIAMYGAYPHERQRGLIALKPVLRLETRVIELKSLKAGSPVGYGGTFSCMRDSKIAILPIGYADGYPRLVSNRGAVLVRGKRAPIAGRISMDLMAVDVTDIPGAVLHDPVTLIGSDGTAEIRVEEVALWAETISYEILTGLMPRVHREYV